MAIIKKSNKKRTNIDSSIDAINEALSTDPVLDASKDLKADTLLASYSTGNTSRDLVGIEGQLAFIINKHPDRFATMSKEALEVSWEKADKINKATAWIKGHVVLAMDKKYGNKAVANFAETHNVSRMTINNFKRLAEMFPKVDPLLDPTFHIKAMTITHGDKERTLKLIEMARDHKKQNKDYSVSQFVKDAVKKHSKKAVSKDEDVIGIVKKISTLLGKIKLSKNIKSYKDDLIDIRKIIDELLKSN